MPPWFPLLAQDPAPQQGPPGIVIYVGIIGFGLMMILFFRAQNRQRRELQKALTALKKNDKVVTSGGILGVVVAIKEAEDEVTLKTDDTSNTRVRVLKSSIIKITTGDHTVGEAKTP
ncbi:MAG TPA: preprotein translocase subunit YajC [Gemmataceae bacterium]|nr:preprotein translocase subunit YajC [Gemmataceae bacterium]